MRRFLIAAALLAAPALALAPAAAQATSGAHFFNDTAAAVAGDGSLAVTVDEAGVGQAQVNYTLAWTGTADYGCVNGGGNHPQAANKQTTSTGGTDSFSETPQNGRVHVTISVPGTPPPAAGFSCPNGQALVLADVSYTATLSDDTNGVSTGLAASRVFFTFK